MLLFLYQRKDIGFTCELLADKLGQPIEQIKNSIASLQKRQFLECFEVETAEGILATYKVRMNSALLPFLLFAKEMIAPPEYMYLQLIKREKPLL